MSTKITISEKVYRRLKREKGDRSFSEVIEENLDSGGTLAKVSGQQLFDAETVDRVSEEIESLSHRAVEHVADDTT